MFMEYKETTLFRLSSKRAKTKFKWQFGLKSAYYLTQDDSISTTQAEV